ncbi:hypothetical protein OAD57_10395, partial [Porticoccaceae bacterium]|nr:hypothetical protein [Porticoccaceae bacterium]
LRENDGSAGKPHQTKLKSYPPKRWPCHGSGGTLPEYFSDAPALRCFSRTSSYLKSFSVTQELLRHPSEGWGPLEQQSPGFARMTF